MPATVNVTNLKSAEVRLSHEAWEFEAAYADKIDTYWAYRCEQQPTLFNGEVLMLRYWSLQSGRFSGQCIKADYKSFLYWREHNAPDPSVVDFFATAALYSREGWLILGRSGTDMSNAGEIYPPCGSLQLGEFGRDLDLDASIVREVHEETGIEIDSSQLGPPVLIEAFPQLVLIRPANLEITASEIVHRIDRHLRSTATRELDGSVVVKDRSAIQEAMPPFTIAYIRYVFREERDK